MSNDPGLSGDNRRSPVRRVRIAVATLGSMVLAAAVSYLVPEALEAISNRDSKERLEVDVVQLTPFSEPSWFVPVESLTSLGAPPECGTDEWDTWMRHRGGSLVGGTFLQVTVTSSQDETVVIEDFSVKRRKLDWPFGGVVIICPVGGSLEERSLSVNLDSPVPQVEYLSADDEPQRRFAFTLKKGEVERFFIEASAEQSAYSWFAEMTVLVGTERTRHRIDDGGREFKAIPKGIWQQYEQVGSELAPS